VQVRKWSNASQGGQLTAYPLSAPNLLRLKFDSIFNAFPWISYPNTAKMA